MYDLSLEKQVISSMINFPRCLDYGMGIIEPQDLTVIKSEPLYREAYKVLGEIWESGKQVNAEVVAARMDREVLNHYGVSWLFAKGMSFTDSGFEESVSRLKELTACRKLAAVSEKMLNLSVEGKLKEALAIGQDGVFAAEVKTEAPKILNPEEHADNMLELLSKRKEKGSNGGIYTRFPKLNRYVNGGFGKGDLVIIAAETGKGKTAFALNLVESFAVVQKETTLYINTEMSDEQIAARWLTIIPHDPAITHDKVAMGQITDFEQAKIWKAMESMKGSGFHSVNEPDLTLPKVEAIIRRFNSKKPLRVAVVDYVGRMDTQDPKLQEWQVLTRIAKRLKTIAQQQQITVVMLAQLNYEGRLQGAKAMENEADVYISLDYPNLSTKEGQTLSARLEAKGANMTIHIRKNRGGRSGHIPANFIGERLTFEEVIDDAVQPQRKQEHQANSKTPERAAESYSLGFGR